MQDIAYLSVISMCMSIYYVAFLDLRFSFIYSLIIGGVTHHILNMVSISDFLKLVLLLILILDQSYTNPQPSPASTREKWFGNDGGSCSPAVSF